MVANFLTVWAINAQNELPHQKWKYKDGTDLLVANNSDIPSFQFRLIGCFSKSAKG